MCLKFLLKTLLFFWGRRNTHFLSKYDGHIGPSSCLVCLVNPFRSQLARSTTLLSSSIFFYPGWASIWYLSLEIHNAVYIACWARIIITTANHHDDIESTATSSTKNRSPNRWRCCNSRFVAKDAQSFLFVFNETLAIETFTRTILCVPVFTTLCPSGAIGVTPVAKVL